MSRTPQKEISVLIDKVTNSIEHANSGKIYETDVLPVTKDEVKTVLKRMDGNSIGEQNSKKQITNCLS